LLFSEAETPGGEYFALDLPEILQSTPENHLPILLPKKDPRLPAPKVVGCNPPGQRGQHYIHKKQGAVRLYSHPYQASKPNTRILVRCLLCCNHSTSSEQVWFLLAMIISLVAAAHYNVVRP